MTMQVKPLTFAGRPYQGSLAEAADRARRLTVELTPDDMRLLIADVTAGKTDLYRGRSVSEGYADLFLRIMRRLQALQSNEENEGSPLEPLGERVFGKAARLPQMPKWQAYANPLVGVDPSRKSTEFTRVMDIGHWAACLNGTSYVEQQGAKGLLTAPASVAPDVLTGLGLITGFAARIKRLVTVLSEDYQRAHAGPLTAPQEIEIHPRSDLPYWQGRLGNGKDGQPLFKELEVREGFTFLGAFPNDLLKCDGPPGSNNKRHFLPKDPKVFFTPRFFEMPDKRVTQTEAMLNASTPLAGKGSYKVRHSVRRKQNAARKNFTSETFADAVFKASSVTPFSLPELAQKLGREQRQLGERIKAAIQEGLTYALGDRSYQFVQVRPAKNSRTPALYALNPVTTAVNDKTLMT